MKDWSWYYFRFWIKLAVKLFYRRIEVHGTDTYPQEGPVLLAPNHQNAFMDALIPSIFARRPIHYLTRSDVFKNKLMAMFLTSIKMMPVYRQRDGLGNLAKNEVIFAKCADILRSGGTLLIFPETTHQGVRRLRPLSKGFTRVLFGALEDHDDLNIKVVPLGINYSHYHKSGTRLVINYGAPISVSDYRKAHQDNAPKAMTALRDDVQEALAKEVVHLERKDANDAFEIELEHIIPFFRHRAEGFIRTDGREMDFYKTREQQLMNLPEGHNYFRRIGIYGSEMLKRRLFAPFFFISSKDAGYWLVQHLLLLIMSPVFALSWLLMAPAYFLMRTLLVRYIADRQFWSSIKLVGYLVLVPLFGIIYALIGAYFSQRPWIALGTVLLFYPFSVFVIRELRLPYRHLFTLWRGLWLKWRKPSLHKYLLEIEGEILKTFKAR